MADIVLDTNILADLLAQYYDGSVRENGRFEIKGLLNKDLVRRINNILKWYSQDYTGPYPGRVIASTLAFVEIARKFDEIAAGRFTVPQFAAFINQPPEWFLISSIDSTLFPYLSSLPGEIVLSSGDVRPIEWTDAIHVATAMSRDEPWLIAVTDARLKELKILYGKFI